MKSDEGVGASDAPPSERPIGRHLLPDSASIGTDGRLSIGGIDLVELAEMYGTPLFVYDEDHLRARCREAVGAFGEGVAYATKAFLCKAMASLAVEAGMRLDVSTGGELAVALAAGVDAEHLVLHGNNKSAEELERALSLGVHRIVVDSFDEIRRLERLSPGARRAVARPQAVLIRLTPGVEAGTHAHVTTGIEDTKFGFSVASGSADEAVEALRRIQGLSLVGVHAHLGSQIFSLRAFRDELAVLGPFIEHHQLGELCIGGGLGVAYLNDERAPSISDWAAFAGAAAAEVGIRGELVLTAEPGRAVVATAGLTCYTVGTIKDLPGIRRYVAVDGGMSDNPRPVLYGSGYEAFLPRAAAAERPLSARLVGKHCESGDVLVAEARLPADLAVGDILATPVTGAYGFSMASNYNRLPRPPVVFVRDGLARVVVRREEIDDLLRLEP